MVNVDTVYQKVLALANKEQRGYITPQEFSLLADKAQLELVNNYFHAVKMAHLKPKNQSEAYDDIEMLREKLSYIRRQEDGITYDASADSSNSSTLSLPTNSYLINTVMTDGVKEVVEVDRHRLLMLLSNPLTSPTSSRRVYVRKTSTLTSAVSTITIEVHPALGDEVVSIDYLIRPPMPKWGYVVVNEKALYNANTSSHFSLHPTEEEPLVTKILQLAGVVIEKPQLQQSAMVDRQQTRQEQNS